MRFSEEGDFILSIRRMDDKTLNQKYRGCHEAFTELKALSNEKVLSQSAYDVITDCEAKLPFYKKEIKRRNEKEVKGEMDR